MANLLFFIYDLFFICGLILYLPYYFHRKKINFYALKQKLGFFGKNLKNLENTIWIQVVSVGEANLIEKFVKRIRELFDYPILITTTTLTANKIAKAKYKDIAQVLFFPFDITFVIQKLISLFNPKIFIAVETELWPNLFFSLEKKNIPIIVINARISDKAFLKYKLIRPIMANVLKKCSYIGAQNQNYKDRFIYLGAKSDKMIVSGNMKFDSISVNEKYLEKLRNRYLNIIKPDNSFLIVAGSTHYPEEEGILRVYNEIINTGENASLLIAPRHIERVVSIEKNIASSGLTPVRISAFAGCNNQNKNVFILDTIGDLIYFYSFADICFIGGSLSGHGGHNILEPIFFLKPTIFGPNMSNFQDIKEIILSKEAGIEVNDYEELKAVLIKLMDDADSRAKLRVKCMDVFEGQRKALNENIKIVLECLK